jgi:hemerythrin superfamily protein
MAKSNGRSPSTSRREPNSAKDAIALLKSDHRQVEAWFRDFEKAKDSSRKKTLAEQICGALKVHTQIEEEIFYPAFLESTEYEDIHHEARIEHEGAKRLIREIEAQPSDEYFDARVAVLSEMIKHHVKEEEKPGGMFAKARQADMDLRELGEQLQARKSELEGDRSLPGRAKKLAAPASSSIAR